MSEEIPFSTPTDPIADAQEAGDLAPVAFEIDEFPTWDDPAVLDAIQRERDSYQEREMADTSAADEAYGSPLDPATPLVEFPDSSKVNVLGLVELNVMHNGAPALRKFHASNAYQPPT